MQIRHNLGLTSFAFFLWRTYWRSQVGFSSNCLRTLFAYCIDPDLTGMREDGLFERYINLG